MNVSSIASSNLVYLVATPELPAVRNLIQRIEYLRRWQCPGEKIRVILNRYSKRSAMTRQQIEDAIGMPVARVLPNDFPAMTSAIHAGAPLPPETRSELATVMRKWAKHLTKYSDERGAAAELRFKLAAGG